VPTQDLQRHLARETEIHREVVQRYRGYADAEGRGGFGDSPQTVVIRLHDALAERADRARTVPPAEQAT
jgi:hypothetical protein